MSDLTELQECGDENDGIIYDQCLLENAMFAIKTSSTYLGKDSLHKYKISGSFSDFALAMGNYKLIIKAIYSSRESGFYSIQLIAIKFLQNLNDTETPKITFTSKYSNQTLKPGLGFSEIKLATISTTATTGPADLLITSQIEEQLMFYFRRTSDYIKFYLRGLDLYLKTQLSNAVIDKIKEALPPSRLI